MIRYFLAKGDRAGNAVIIEGLPDCSCSNPPPSVQIATLYMKTYCTACKQEGIVAPKGPRWPGTASNGKPWALSGDINVCGCEPAPVFYAVRGMTMSFNAEEVARSTTPPARMSSGVAATSSALDKARYVARFIVRDSATGKPLANRDFVADVGGIQRSGKTDGQGHAKVVTNGEQSVSIHVFFSSPKRDLKPRQGA
ncbi:hypothetical protein [Burkholderia sp. 22PA0106]|uniref:hypothetical protein n=1 Tax=Burkholderia sp. 22PA0106 TaxID=3237371 RepID=UPI0039C37E0B